MITTPDGRIFYWAPDDNVQNAILAQLQNAQHEIRLSMYALCLVPAIDLLIAAHQRGVDVRCVLDSSQAGTTNFGLHIAPGYQEAWTAVARATQTEEVGLGGSPEAAQLLRLRNAGVPFVLGQSSKGNILHEKAVMIDGAICGYGSFNWSLSASSQSNHWVFDPDPDVTAAFRAQWVANWNRLGGTPAG